MVKMYTFNFKVFLGLFYAITVALCAPHPTQNLDAGTVQTPATPGLDSLHRLRKRSKVGEIVGFVLLSLQKNIFIQRVLPIHLNIQYRFFSLLCRKVLTALDVGSEGVAKLIGDVLKLQKDFGSILKQLKSAGISEESCWENHGHPLGPRMIYTMKQANFHFLFSSPWIPKRYKSSRSEAE
jgi:hypothetical protein